MERYHNRLYAIRALANALAPLIGAESALGKAVSSGWADSADPSQIDEWRKKGNDLILKDVETLFQDTCAEEYRRLMHKVCVYASSTCGFFPCSTDTCAQRLGLRRVDNDDESKLVQPLLDIMYEHKFDFHSTFRRLSYFRATWVQSTSAVSADANADANKGALDDYVASLLALTPDSELLDKTRASDDWKQWLEKYASRTHSERAEWGDDDDVDAVRTKEMRGANPRFVLRQWVLEEVIKKVEQDTRTGKRVLRKVLQVSLGL